MNTHLLNHNLTKPNNLPTCKMKKKKYITSYHNGKTKLNKKISLEIFTAMTKATKPQNPLMSNSENQNNR